MPTLPGEMLGTYARIVGVGLFLPGLAGFASVIDTAVPTNIHHACVGAPFAYLGFLQPDAPVVRRVVGGMGLMLLIVRGAGSVAPLLRGGRSLVGPVELTRFVVGVLSVLLAACVGDGGPPEGA